jgi:hypothetical protein
MGAAVIIVAATSTSFCRVLARRTIYGTGRLLVSVIVHRERRAVSSAGERLPVNAHLGGPTSLTNLRNNFPIPSEEIVIYLVQVRVTYRAASVNLPGPWSDLCPLKHTSCGTGIVGA